MREIAEGEAWKLQTAGYSNLSECKYMFTLTVVNVFVFFQLGLVSRTRRKIEWFYVYGQRPSQKSFPILFHQR